jgi:hypothetical protein
VDGRGCECCTPFLLFKVLQRGSVVSLRRVRALTGRLPALASTSSYRASAGASKQELKKAWQWMRGCVLKKDLRIEESLRKTSSREEIQNESQT